MATYKAQTIIGAVETITFTSYNTGITAIFRAIEIHAKPAKHIYIHVSVENHIISMSMIFCQLLLLENSTNSSIMYHKN